MSERVGMALVALLSVGALSACGPFPIMEHQVLVAFDRHDPQAMAIATERLEQAPESNRHVRVTASLDLALLLQRDGRYEQSERLYQQAEELLDWDKTQLLLATHMTMGSHLKRYVRLGTGNSVTYLPSPDERILVHAFRSLNQLALGTISATRVQARRLDDELSFLYDELGLPREQATAEPFAAFIADFARTAGTSDGTVDTLLVIAAGRAPTKARFSNGHTGPSTLWIDGSPFHRRVHHSGLEAGPEAPSSAQVRIGDRVVPSQMLFDGLRSRRVTWSRPARKFGSGLNYMSWTLLPARIWVVRTALPRGRHRVEIQVGSTRIEHELEVGRPADSNLAGPATVGVAPPIRLPAPEQSWAVKTFWVRSPPPSADQSSRGGPHPE